MMVEEIKKDTYATISEFIRESIRLMLRRRGRKI